MTSAFPVVLVEWDDACGGSPDGWVPLEDVLEAARLEPCVSVGYLVHKTDRYLVVASHLSKPMAPDTETSGAMYIPLGAVREIKTLVPIRLLESD